VCGLLITTVSDVVAPSSAVTSSGFGLHDMILGPDGTPIVLAGVDSGAVCPVPICRQPLTNGQRVMAIVPGAMAGSQFQHVGAAHGQPIITCGWKCALWAVARLAESLGVRLDIQAKATELRPESVNGGSVVGSTQEQR